MIRWRSLNWRGVADLWMWSAAIQRKRYAPGADGSYLFRCF